MKQCTVDDARIVVSLDIMKKNFQGPAWKSDNVPFQSDKLEGDGKGCLQLILLSTHKTHFGEDALKDCSDP